MKDAFEHPWLHPELADPDGLAGVGGDLTPSTLLLAYAEGVFPWFNENDPVLWWSPDPRGVFEFDQLNISRRLARTVRSGKFTITFNTRFTDVMQACGEHRVEGTWVTESMVEAYTALHRLGHAHSVEAWLGSELVGGVYGVSLGAFFSAESMFYRASDASKVALLHLVERLKQRGFILLDTQMTTEHTRSLGAISIPRTDYLKRLRTAIRLNSVRFG